MFRFFALVLSLLVLGNPAQARDAHVACVQAQLARLGLDPGPVDGLSGPRTRSAVKALVGRSGASAQAVFETLPAFSKRAAVGWCREIARAHPLTAGLRPSAELPARFVSDEVSPQMRAHLWIAHTTAKRFLKDTYGVDLASRYDLVAAVSPEAFRREVRKTQEGRQIPSEQLNNSARRNCRGPLGGSMFRNTMTFCGTLLAETDPAALPNAQAWLRAVMVHEYVHHMQRELAYDKVPRWVKQGTKVRRRLGPAWMVEGSAQVIEQRYLTPDRARDRYRLYLMRSRSEAADTSLRSVRRDENVTSEEAYQVSLYAVELLARRYGDQSLIAFWRAVGETDNWYTAFERTFGMTVQDYEVLFERLVTDPMAGFEFVDNSDKDGDGLIAGREDLPAPGTTF